MKRGEIVILWIGGILSAALLVLYEAPDPIQQKVSLTLGGHVVNLFTKLALIWIICGLVWVTLYKRSHPKDKESTAKSIEVNAKSSPLIESRESTIGHLRAFLAAIVRDWIGRMSGGGGLLLTVLGFFSPPAWQPQAFLVLGALCLFYACYRAWLSEHEGREQLLQRLAPRLEFVRVNKAKSFYEEFRDEAGHITLRYLRVGLHNLSPTDEISQARLLLEACQPDLNFIVGDKLFDPSPAVHPQHELQPMCNPQGTLTVTIPPDGTVLFDVAREVIEPGQNWGRFLLCYAQPLQNELPPRGDETYKIFLRAEGAGPAIRCSLELGGRLAWRLARMASRWLDGLAPKTRKLITLQQIHSSGGADERGSA